MKVTNCDNMILIHGTEPHLIREKVAELEVGISEDAKEILKEASISSLITAAQTLSMFCPKKLIKVYRASFFSGSLTPKQAKELDGLIEAIQLSDHTIVFIEDKKPLDKRKKAVKLILKAATCHEFQSFKDWETEKIVDWVQKKFQKLEKTIDRNSARKFVEFNGKELSILAMEIEKATVFMGKDDDVSFEKINQLMGGQAANLFAFNDAFKLKKVSEVVNHATSLMESGEDPIKLFGMVGSNLRLYMSMVSLKNRGYSVDKIAKTLSKNPYFIQKLMQDVTRNYSEEKLKQLYKIVCEKDLFIKTGKQPADTALLLFLLNLAD
ncbi:DNA polymerase III subunit delta [bacterium]|nr:DNA polymerase III subunit delta [bacterium]